ncbi:MAG: hypothetical protein AAF235_01150 [Planctomycetota bacterium]
MKRRRTARLLLGLATPFILILGGAGLAALGFSMGSLMMIIAGLVVAAAGVLWCVIMLDLTNPFDW